jgi:hypothetical protein
MLDGGKRPHKRCAYLLTHDPAADLVARRAVAREVTFALDAIQHERANAPEAAPRLALAPFDPVLCGSTRLRETIAGADDDASVSQRSRAALRGGDGSFRGWLAARGFRVPAPGALVKIQASRDVLPHGRSNR